MFAANANVITDIHPALALGAGLILAGGVHTAKGVARPVVTASTAGTGNWLVSTVEDVAAFSVSIVAIFVPIIAAIVLLVMLFWGIRWYRNRQRRQQTKYAR